VLNVSPTKQNAVRAIQRWLPSLTDEQRLELLCLLFQGYCPKCGRKLRIGQRGCYCDYGSVDES
jgi:hypothetical protein